jgi:site-specific DNA recombinase
MVRNAERGLFERLIVHKVDRFARSQYDGIVYKQKLKNAGVLIEYVGQSINPEDKNSKMMEGILLVMAEQYSENLAHETMKGLKENAYQGKFNGGYAPFGFDIIDGRYVVNEHEAHGVRAIFDMYVQGKGYKDILRFLQDAGFKTRQGRDFGKNSLHSILNNERYMGTYVFNKVKRREDGSRNSHSSSDEIILVPDAIPAIISKEQFEAARQKMRKNKKRPGAFLPNESTYCPALSFGRMRGSNAM